MFSDSLCRGMLSHEAQRPGDRAFPPCVDDQIEHAVLEQELAALKALGKLLPDGCSITRSAKPMSARFRDVQISKQANSMTPPVVGSVSTKCTESPPDPPCQAAQIFASASVKSAFHHPRTPRQDTMRWACA